MGHLFFPLSVGQWPMGPDNTLIVRSLQLLPCPVLAILNRLDNPRLLCVVFLLKLDLLQDVNVTRLGIAYNYPYL